MNTLFTIGFAVVIVLFIVWFIRETQPIITLRKREAQDFSDVSFDLPFNTQISEEEYELMMIANDIISDR